MKSLKLPTDQGVEWWILTHSLTLKRDRLDQLRPIHVFTLLAQHRVGNKLKMFRLCMSLENKLFAVSYQARELRRAISSVGELVYPEAYVRDYRSNQELIAALEAYLNAIYSALEIAAQMNQLLRPELPQSFRKQSRKFAPFGFTARPWLARFLDVRSEFSHYSSPLPSVAEGKIVLDFQNPSDLEVFPKGRHAIQFGELLQWATELFDMLDAWSVEELQRIDPAAEVDCFRQTTRDQALKPFKAKASDFLRLLRIRQQPPYGSGPTTAEQKHPHDRGQPSTRRKSKRSVAGRGV